ncbi:hypothetical protein DIPPA_17250 [Diplonema papillatum]|nr:hypothetical protein DIPPA_17250 [Diplonema papillatum]
MFRTPIVSFAGVNQRYPLTETADGTSAWSDSSHMAYHGFVSFAHHDARARSSDAAQRTGRSLSSFSIGTHTDAACAGCQLVDRSIATLTSSPDTAGYGYTSRDSATRRASTDMLGVKTASFT